MILKNIHNREYAISTYCRYHLHDMHILPLFMYFYHFLLWSLTFIGFQDDATVLKKSTPWDETATIIYHLEEWISHPNDIKLGYFILSWLYIEVLWPFQPNNPTKLWTCPNVINSTGEPATNSSFNPDNYFVTFTIITHVFEKSSTNV